MNTTAPRGALLAAPARDRVLVGGSFAAGSVPGAGRTVPRIGAEGGGGPAAPGDAGVVGARDGGGTRKWVPPPFTRVGGDVSARCA